MNKYFLKASFLSFTIIASSLSAGESPAKSNADYPLLLLMLQELMENSLPAGSIPTHPLSPKAALPSNNRSAQRAPARTSPRRENQQPRKLDQRGNNFNWNITPKK